MYIKYKIYFISSTFIYSTLSFEDMTYLTIDQILADLTHVIADIKAELNAPTAKVIVFGAGFGGTLATWLRIKFPHIIDAVWSSSGIFSADLFTEGKVYPISFSKFDIYRE